MTTDPIDDLVRRDLTEIPLSADAQRRLRVRLGREVEARRLELLEGALHGGFALAAVAWTILVLVR